MAGRTPGGGLVHDAQLVEAIIRVASVLDALVNVPPKVAMAHEQLSMLGTVV